LAQRTFVERLCASAGDTKSAAEALDVITNILSGVKSALASRAAVSGAKNERFKKYLSSTPSPAKARPHTQGTRLARSARVAARNHGFRAPNLANREHLSAKGGKTERTSN